MTIFGYKSHLFVSCEFERGGDQEIIKVVFKIYKFLSSLEYPLDIRVSNLFTSRMNWSQIYIIVSKSLHVQDPPLSLSHLHAQETKMQYHPAVFDTF